jgi:hypothetical protein
MTDPAGYVGARQRDGSTPDAPSGWWGDRLEPRDWAVRGLWVGISVLPLAVCGVVTGKASLDGMAIAPWVRAVIVLAALGGLAAVARAVSVMLTASANVREARTGGPLVRSVAVGPPRRWAMWLATLAIASVVAYLLNEHRPAAPRLDDIAPVRPLNVVALLGLGVLAPFIADLARGGPTRRVPWAALPPAHRAMRDDEDLFGVVMRLSPVLLGALVVAVAIYTPTLVVGIHAPAKLLGGVGVLGLYLAALLAEPDLLRAPDELMRQAWRTRWYERQLRGARRARRTLEVLHRLALPAQVIAFAIAIGTIASGSPPAARGGVAIAAVTLLVAIVSATITRILWYWAIKHDEPIDARILSDHDARLKTLAGCALVVGSLCSLVAILLA